MKTKTSTPFKMRGFSGFGSSPVRDNGDGDGDKKGGAGSAIAGAVGDALVASIKDDRSPTVNEDPNEGFTNLKMGV